MPNLARAAFIIGPFARLLPSEIFQAIALPSAKDANITLSAPPFTKNPGTASNRLIYNINLAVKIILFYHFPQIQQSKYFYVIACNFATIQMPLS
jgi:hypothetical protein